MNQTTAREAIEAMNVAMNPKNSGNLRKRAASVALALLPEDCEALRARLLSVLGEDGEHLPATGGDWKEDGERYGSSMYHAGMPRSECSDDCERAGWDYGKAWDNMAARLRAIGFDAIPEDKPRAYFVKHPSEHAPRSAWKTWEAASAHLADGCAIVTRAPGYPVRYVPASDSIRANAAHILRECSRSGADPLAMVSEYPRSVGEALRAILAAPSEAWHGPDGFHARYDIDGERLRIDWRKRPDIVPEEAGEPASLARLLRW